MCGEVKEGMIGCDSSVQHTCIVRESKPIRTGHTKRTRERERVTQQNDACGEAIKRDSNFARKKNRQRHAFVLKMREVWFG